MDTDRDALGRIVRAAWVRWARTQPDPKPTWLVSYDDLSEPDREADRQIGEAVRDHLRVERDALQDRLDRIAMTLGLALGDRLPGQGRPSAKEWREIAERAFQAAKGG
jgi:hypothetical protein